MNLLIGKYKKRYVEIALNKDENGNTKIISN